MLVFIRGAGDLASGVALRLHRAGLQVVMAEIPRPTAIRRTVAFSQAVALGETTVEDVTARRATVDTAAAVLSIAAEESIPLPSTPSPRRVVLIFL